MTEPESEVRVVAIDDDPLSLDLIQSALESEGVAVRGATDPEEGWAVVREQRPQIVVLDLVMPGLSGLELLDRILEWDPGTNVVLLTGQYSTDSAVEAIRKGACDYLTKPISVEALRQRISRLLDEARVRSRALQLESELLHAYQFETMIGRSPLMLEVFSRIRRVAPHFRTVLVTGETGTGKELVARALHRLSPAALGPFVACNCSAIADTLFESELFGYMRGAFTGATQDKIGMIEYAQGGTLFLDEIGDMPLGVQSKLLRVLQNREVQRVGSPAVRRVDVRVVAVTNRDLRALAAGKQFRDDLYYRLSMIEIEVPPLVQRREDLPLLQRYFIENFAGQYQRVVKGLTRRTQSLLTRYSWPGNVRELENVLGYACMMAEKDFIDIRDLPEYLRKQAAPGAVEDEQLLPLDELERRHARRVLDRVGGNRVRAAEVLGISRATLYRLLAESKAAPLQQQASRMERA
jgi:DNA-binding NtrC family response regulator